jgi:hypothetical protein
MIEKGIDDVSFIDAFATDPRLLCEEVRTLRAEVARLREIEVKYTTLLNEHVRHAEAMAEQALSLLLRVPDKKG